GRGRGVMAGGRRPGGAGVHAAGRKTAVFPPAEPLQGGVDVKLVIRLRHETEPRLAIGKFRLSLTSLDGVDASADGVPEAVLTALRKAGGARLDREAVS